MRLGGALVEEWSDSSGRLVVTSGDVTEMQTERLLVLSWRDQGWPADTEVRIEIEPLEGGRSRLTLTHSGWDAFPAERREQLVTAHRSGWERHLASLADHLGG